MHTCKLADGIEPCMIFYPIVTDLEQLCEVVMDQFDYPWRLSTQVEIAKQKF